MAEGGVRHYKEWTPRLINRSRYEYEDESKETSTIMNLLGYGPVIRQKRKDSWKEWDRLWNARGDTVITAGSKAEGLTCVYESDYDVILVLPNTVCLEDGFDESTIPGHINVFKMNMQSCSAGYCRLLLERQGLLGQSIITNSLVDDGNGSFIMSSTFFVDHFKTSSRSFEGTVNHARAGPSLPWSIGPSRNDRVYAIRCDCLIILQKWASRARHWPPPEIVEKVIAMRAFVTPIGFKYSEHNHVEWKICFNAAETELVNSLNDTQVKIYVILKLIVKDLLKPQTKEITSYILKNIVLWQAENNPQTLFHSGSLFHWIHEGLDVLRTAISESQLPYYMIPDRNLMAERGLEIEQQRELVRSVTDMINEGPRMLLRLKKVRQAIVCHPEPLLWYSKMRTELELLHLKIMNRTLQCFDWNVSVNESDIILRALLERMCDVVQEVTWRMLREGSSVNDWTQLYEMMLSSGRIKSQIFRSIENCIFDRVLKGMITFSVNLLIYISPCDTLYSY